MLAVLLLGGGMLAHSEAQASDRTYYIAAEEVNWDYSPGRSDLAMGGAFGEVQNVFVERTEDRIGSVYKKAHYVAYTDDRFEARAESDLVLGILGPTLHAAVGDTIRVLFRNKTARTVSIHPHGVFYNKDSEGAPTNDETVAADKSDDAVAPGGSHVYTWPVPERAGPGPADPSSIVWLYHSHVDEVADTNSGLVGAIVVAAKDAAGPDGRPKDVDKEFVMLFSVMDENKSLYLKDMMADLKSVPEKEEEFEESNLMHSINGYVYGHLPLPTMKVGERVRWYLLSMGTEVDLHTPHWHGNTVLAGGHRADVVDLLPASVVVADMIPDNPGLWLFHCHVNDHLEAGMSARYAVRPTP